MSAEGRLSIRVRREAGAGARVSIASTRPLGLSRRFEGRDVADVVRDLPRLFSVCGIAQAAACCGACAAATGQPIPAEAGVARGLLVSAETLREHLLALAGDGRPGGGPGEDALPALRIVADLRRALAADPFGPDTDAGAGVDARRADDVIAGIETLLRDRVFGEPPSDWLRRSDPAGFVSWARAAGTRPARRVARLLDAGWQGRGAASIGPLPTLPGRALFERLVGGDEGFVAEPEWDGAPRETTPLARQRAQPLVAALVSEYGGGLLARFAARLVEVAALPGAMRAALAERMPMPPGEALGDGDALMQVEAARGRLVHAVKVDRGRVRAYRILAPTEWNFHPRGAVARGLAALEGDGDAVRAQAEVLIGAVDPCVAVDLVVS